MALVPCRECGRDVAATASTCPHCGVAYPNSKAAAVGKQLQSCGCILTLLVTLPMLLLLGFC